LDPVSRAFFDSRHKRLVCASGSSLVVWDVSAENTENIKETLLAFSVRVGAELDSNGILRYLSDVKRLRMAEQLKAIKKG
jgi:hypothetical protein